MNGKTGIAILVVLCVGLGAALLVRHKKAVALHEADEARIKQLSDDVVRTQTKLTEQQKVNLILETNLAIQVIETEIFSNRLNQTSLTLTEAESAAKAAAQASKEEIAKRDAKIAELEGQNDDLTRKMGDLNSSIGNLEVAISETERRLAASEGDREALVKELKRLQAEKAELERRFNDLAAVREQLRRLRDELSIARRLEWIRRGLYGPEKGAEKLQKGLANPPALTNYDLNVEIRQDGNARIVPGVTNTSGVSPAP